MVLSFAYTITLKITLKVVRNVIPLMQLACGKCRCNRGRLAEGLLALLFYLFFMLEEITFSIGDNLEKCNLT